MNLKEKINQDIQQAILSKDTDKLAALRAVKSAILLESAKDGNNNISDKVILGLIRKLVKQRKESSSIYIEQGREDLANDEIIQLKYLEEYLPDPIPTEKIRKAIKEIIIKINASSRADMGRIIGAVLKEFDNQVDGNIVSDLVLKEFDK